MKKTNIIQCVFLSVLLQGGVASRADIITQTQNVALTSMDWSTALPFTQFNPALGTLNSITFNLGVAMEGSVGVENLDLAAPNLISFTFTGQFTLLRPDLSPILGAQPTTSATNAYAIFDSTIDFGGLSGQTFSGLSITSANSLVTSSPGELTLFTGLGSINLPLGAIDLSSALGEIGKADPVIDITPLGRSGVTLTYDYTAVPEPQTALLMLLGLIGIRLVAKTKRN